MNQDHINRGLYPHEDDLMVQSSEFFSLGKDNTQGEAIQRDILGEGIQDDLKISQNLDFGENGNDQMTGNRQDRGKSKFEGVQVLMENLKREINQKFEESEIKESYAFLKKIGDPEIKNKNNMYSIGANDKIAHSMEYFGDEGFQNSQKNQKIEIFGKKKSSKNEKKLKGKVAKERREKSIKKINDLNDYHQVNEVNLRKIGIPHNFSPSSISSENIKFVNSSFNNTPSQKRTQILQMSTNTNNK